MIMAHSAVQASLGKYDADLITYNYVRLYISSMSAT